MLSSAEALQNPTKMVKMAYGLLYEQSDYLTLSQMIPGRQGTCMKRRKARQRERVIRTPELADKIRKFPVKDRRASLLTFATQFGVDENKVRTILPENLNMRRFNAKSVARLLDDNEKVSLVNDNREMAELITLSL